MHGFSIEEREMAGKERMECGIWNGEWGVKCTGRISVRGGVG
jgi:hypothetical protein